MCSKMTSLFFFETILPIVRIFLYLDSVGGLNSKFSKSFTPDTTFYVHHNVSLSSR